MNELDALLIEEIALLQAKARTGGDVYMDGHHMPSPHERREAEDLVMGYVRRREANEHRGTDLRAKVSDE